MESDGGQSPGGDVVYLPAQGNGNGSQVAHTDRECSRLKTARKVHEYPRESARDKRICKYCRGEVSPSGGNNSGLWKTLEEMSPDDLATDGSGLRKDPSELVVLECAPCEYETVVARGAIRATSCPDCQGELEIVTDRVAHKCPESSADHVIVGRNERCPFCQSVQRRAATDGGLKGVYRRETIVETDDGFAIGEAAAEAINDE